MPVLAAVLTGVRLCVAPAGRCCSARTCWGAAAVELPTPAITPTNGQSPRARHAQGPAQISVDDLPGNLLARTSRAMSAVCVYTARSAALCGVALLLVVCAGLAFGADVRTGGDETTPAITPMNGDGHQEESKLALLCSDHLRGTAPVGSSKWGVFVFLVFRCHFIKGCGTRPAWLER